MERELHKTIQQFIKIRETCIFCHSSMRTVLSSFLGLRNSGMPLLNSPVKDNKIDFIINETTEKSAIKAVGTIDISNNNLLFKAEASEHDKILLIEDESRRDLLLYTEETFAKQAFENLSPHIEIYCSNKKCKFNYYLSGDIVRCSATLGKLSDVIKWKIKPFLLYQETFATETLWVQNDWIHLYTNIYPLHGSSHADPIKVPLMDFKMIDKQKLLNRIKTLVVFT